MGPLRDLLETVRHYWHAPTVLAVGILFGVFVLITAFDPNEFDREIPEGGVPVEASITSMASNRTRYLGKPPGISVGATTPEGLHGQVLVFPREISGCQVGDRIEAVQIGFRIYLTPSPCD